MPRRQVDDFIPLELAGDRQQNVARRVAAAVVVAHLFARQGGDALAWCRARSAPAGARRNASPSLFVGHEGRLVLVHPDLFEDHLLLRLEIFLAQRRPQDVGQQIERCGLILGQHRRVE